MMRRPLRYLSRISEVCSDILIEKLCFHSFSVCFLHLSVSHSEKILLSPLWTWCPPSDFPTIPLFLFDITLPSRAAQPTVLSPLLQRFLSFSRLISTFKINGKATVSHWGGMSPLLLLLLLRLPSASNTQQKAGVVCETKCRNSSDNSSCQQLLAKLQCRVKATVILVSAVTRPVSRQRS